MIKKIIIPVIFFITIFFIEFGFYRIDKYVDDFNNTEVEISVEDGRAKDVDVAFEVTISKHWNDTDTSGGLVQGAQYDAVIKNKSKFDFHSWRIVIDMTQEVSIDSIWNVSHELQDYKFTFLPYEHTNNVLSNDEQTFGFVGLSKKIIKFKDYKIYGYYIMSHKDLKIYLILQYVRIAWLVAFLCYIFVKLSLIRYKKRQKRDEKIIIQIIDTFITFIDAKDPYTSGHSQRVAIYTKEIAKRMGVDKDEVRNYFYIALMHDCGKLLVSDDILKKPGALTPDERKAIEAHTVIGADLLKNMTSINGIQDGALQHHERYDGNGYPNKIKGDDISLVGRILCVADAFDAMNSDRCYRDKLPIEKIIEELDNNSGKQFDPDIVKHMLDIIKEGIYDDLVKKFSQKSIEK